LIADVVQHVQHGLIPLPKTAANPPSQPEIPCGMLSPLLEPAAQGLIIFSADWLITFAQQGGGWGDAGKQIEDHEMVIPPVV